MKKPTLEPVNLQPKLWNSIQVNHFRDQPDEVDELAEAPDSLREVYTRLFGVPPEPTSPKTAKEQVDTVSEQLLGKVVELIEETADPDCELAIKSFQVFSIPTVDGWSLVYSSDTNVVYSDVKN